MPYLTGIVLAAGVFLLGRFAGFDRERAFYSTILMVVATYYILFAAMWAAAPGASRHALVMESVAAVVFFAGAVVGFKTNFWIIVVGLIGHGVFDIFHAHLISDPGVPPWWPAFCMAYDVAAGAGLAGLLLSKRLKV